MGLIISWLIISPQKRAWVFIERRKFLSDNANDMLIKTDEGM